jgi:uncharacterized protein (DUF952 family)
MNDTIRRELLDLQAEDLRVRAVLENDGRLFRGYDPEMEAVHRRNAARLNEVITEHGWPGRSMVGDDGAEAAWLIAQHAIGDPAFQRKCLALLEDAARREETPLWQTAYLLDRIRMFEGWPQVYGTQMAPDDEGRMTVWPIAERHALNERRRSVGLRSFEERRTAPMPERTADEQRRQRVTMDTWARKVGWRLRVLHLTTEADWAEAEREGTYRPASLASEGFIHCSEPQQVLWVANRRFRNRLDLVLLHIDILKLKSPGRYENLEGGDQLFPHIYGPLNLDAILKVTPFRPGPAGDFDHDDLAAVY